MERCTWYCFMLSSLSITSSFLQQYNLIIYSETIEGATWLWSYGSWIYNYLCNRCQSPLTLWVWTPFIVRSTTSCDKVCQWLASGRWFSPALRFLPQIKLTTTLVVIGTDCRGSCKSNYHMITTMLPPILFLSSLLNYTVGENLRWLTNLTT
jgi:hypothetical protein